MVAKRLKELKRAEAQEAKDAAKAEKAEKARRLLAQAVNDTAMAEQGKRDRARVEAMRAVRAAQPIMVTITKGRLSVTLDLTSPEPVVRQTAERAVAITVNRLLRWTDAQCGAAAARALGVQGASPMTAEEISAYLADEIRYAIKHGTAQISVAPEMKGKRRK